MLSLLAESLMAFRSPHVLFFTPLILPLELYMYRNAYTKLSSSTHSQEIVGSKEGDILGLVEGNRDGETDGEPDGDTDGSNEGDTDGDKVGATEGNGLGSTTHLPHVITQTS